MKKAGCSIIERSTAFEVWEKTYKKFDWKDLTDKHQRFAAFASKIEALKKESHYNQEFIKGVLPEF